MATSLKGGEPSIARRRSPAGAMLNPDTGSETSPVDAGEPDTAEEEFPGPRLSVGQIVVGAAAAPGLGDEATATAHGRKSVPRPREAVVSLLCGEQFEFTCSNGKEITVGEMLPTVIKGFRLPPEADEVFALHCVSTSLSLQLKPHHQPFKILRKWPELLAMLASHTPEAEMEAPLLYLKRAELCHQGIERKYSDPRIIEVLFQEMTFNVVYSFYPCDLTEAARLAAIHLAIDVGQEPTKDDVDEVEGCQLPDHLRRETSARKWRKLVLDAHEELQFDASGATRDALMLRYIKHGRQWPYYGATFFYGYVEPMEQKSLVVREQPDELVRVGVNLDGIHVIREKTNEVWLSLSYAELQYNSYDKEDGAEESSFLIEYVDKAANGPAGMAPPTKTRLVVWTAQAKMIDSLVSQHIEALSEWDDFVKGRQSERKMTYRPNPNAKGRRKTTPGERHKSGYFTLSKLMLTRKSGGDASSATSASEPAPPANRPSDAAHKPTEI